ncbi:MAG: ABC transporter permease [Propionibacteriaceae bacterium]
MTKFIIRRLVQMLPVVLCTTLLIYLMIYALGDPTVGLCGERACPPAFVAKFNADYNLDKPVLLQYVFYLGKLLHGDLGTSFNGRTVVSQLAAKFPYTIKLSIIAVAFEALVGITAGVLAALRKGRFADNLVLVSTLVVISIPVFVIGSVAQLVLGVKLGIFPVSSSGGSLYQLLLPGFVLGSLSVAYIARLTRNNVVENLRADYVRTAKAKGLSPARSVGIHTLRNSMIPVITYMGTDLGAFMGGAVVTERIFNVPGVGNFLFTSIRLKDGASVVGTVVCLVLIFLVINLFVDIIYGLLDPRIRA